MDTRSPLMKRLVEIMPKKPEQPWDGKSLMHIEMHPIRQAADSFASWMNDDLPANKEELHAMLWVFGEILNGHMERILNDSRRLQDDLLKTMPISETMFEFCTTGFKECTNPDFFKSPPMMYAGTAREPMRRHWKDDPSAYCTDELKELQAKEKA